MNENDLADSIAALDPLVEGDGAVFELVGVDASDRSVTVRLVLDGVECIECVMARDYLEPLALDILRRNVPDLARVSIVDPRDT